MESSEPIEMTSDEAREECDVADARTQIAAWHVLPTGYDSEGTYIVPDP